MLRLCVSLIYLLLVLPVLGWPAIIERGTSTSADTGPDLELSLSFAHNSGTGSETDCATFVGTSHRPEYSLTNGSYGGQAMEKIAEHIFADLRCEIWMLENPPDGSNTVFLERIGGTIRFTAGAVTFCGVDLATPYRTPYQKFQGTITNVSHAVTSGSGELVLGVLTNAGTANPVTTGAGQTQEWNDQTTSTSSANNMVGVGSTEPFSSGTSVTIEYGQGASENYVLCTVSIRPSGVVTPSDVAEGLQPIIP